VREIACVLLGSNIEPERNLLEAGRALRPLGAEAFSAVYRTQAVGAAAPQPDYLNAAARLRTELPPDALKARLRRIEERLGRVRTEDRFAPRPIDLDLVAYGGLAADPDLWVEPHAAVPVAELFPELLHPLSGETIAEAALRLCACAGALERAELRIDMD
jgi:2-amino-4-hydroxy-6-hydroxymethyldihydropteridine diphosphokinase